jgi:hypothetical protein
MRLSEDKIKESILHPDLDVRDVAIRYFGNSTAPDQTLMPRAIEAIEKYGRTNAFSFTNYLNDLPQTEQTIAWVIGELQANSQATSEDSYFYFLNLSRLICQADVQLLAQHAPEILHAPHFDPKQRPAFRERLDMFEWSAQTCWQALHQFCERNRAKNNIEEFDLGRGLRFVEALARMPHEYQAQIVAILSEGQHDLRNDGRKWLQPLMATLAGKMRLHAAIPMLVSNLGHRNGFWADKCLDALIDIGSEEVVTLVSDLYPGAPDDFRLYASDLLCQIHLDLTVERVLELLPSETELLPQIMLCEALIDHFSYEGIEPVRQFVKQHELTPNVRNLRSKLIATCKIMDTRFPEFDLWQAEAREDSLTEQSKMQELKKLMHETGGDLGLLVQRMKEKYAPKGTGSPSQSAQHFSGMDQPPFRGPERHFGSSAPLRVKLGRNDPCPCGSGKKFKICCMRK